MNPIAETIRKAARNITIQLSFASLTVQIIPAGDSLQVLVLGGGKPHIGCTVLAVPRPSLKSDGSFSCTSSVISLTGHKDEEIVRIITEKVCKKYRCVTAGSGGFHTDHMTREQIREVKETVSHLEF